jgi:hypothetical protein
MPNGSYSPARLARNDKPPGFFAAPISDEAPPGGSLGIADRLLSRSILLAGFKRLQDLISGHCHVRPV